MKEYWVNIIYNGWLREYTHHIYSTVEVARAAEKIRLESVIYRLHVKIKSKRGLTRAYPFKWVDGKAVAKTPRYYINDYGKVHSKWLDW